MNEMERQIDRVFFSVKLLVYSPFRFGFRTPTLSQLHAIYFSFLYFSDFNEFHVFDQKFSVTESSQFRENGMRYFFQYSLVCRTIYSLVLSS